MPQNQNSSSRSNVTRSSVVVVPANDAAWAELFAVNLSREREKKPPGDGWRTRADIEKMLGMGRSWAQSYVKAHIAAGRLERFNGFASVNGIIRNQIWYRPVKAAVKAEHHQMTAAGRR